MHILSFTDYSWILGHVTLLTESPGGLSRAVELITEAKKAKGHTDKVQVDLHPDRPDYRGFALGPNVVSLQADPTFEELEAAGGAIQKYDEAHTVLDNFFLISGEIPRQTAYENGVKGGMRFDKEEKDWFSDELISDERFLMCNLKGMLPMVISMAFYFWVVSNLLPFQTRDSSCSQAAAMQVSSTALDMRLKASMALFHFMRLLGASILLLALQLTRKALSRTFRG